MVVQNEQDWVIDGAVGVADEVLQEDGEGFFIHPSRLYDLWILQVIRS